jgi:site-specific recombinase XerD
MASTRVPAASVGAAATLVPSWLRSLRAENKSPRTIQSYEEAARQFVAFLDERGMPAEVASIRREHVEAFIEQLLATRSASTAANRHRSLQQFFRWLDEEGEIEVSPMVKMRPPRKVDQPVDVFSDDEIRALLATCKGGTFEDRRDLAIMRAFLDTGARLAELAGLTLDDVDFDARVLRVTGKGGRARDLPIGRKTARDLDRYERAHSASTRSGAVVLDREARAVRRVRHRSDDRPARRRSPRRECPRAPIPALVRSLVARGRWLRGRPHAARRLEVARDARSVRRERRGRTRARGAQPTLTRRSVLTLEWWAWLGLGWWLGSGRRRKARPAEPLVIVVVLPEHEARSATG